MDFLLSPGHVYLIVEVLNEVPYLTRMPRVGQELFHTKLKRLLIQTEKILMLPHCPVSFLLITAFAETLIS